MEEEGSCCSNLSCLSLLSSPSSPLFSSIVTVYILLILYFPPVLLKIVSWPVLLSTVALLLVLLRIGATQIAEKQSILTGHLSISDGFTRSSSEELCFSALNRSWFSENQNISSGLSSNSLLERFISSQQHGISTEEASKMQGDFSRGQSIVQSEEQMISAEEENISMHDDNWVWSKTEKQPQPTSGFNPLFIDSFLEWDVRAPLEVIYEESEEEKEENESRAMKFHSSLSQYYPESDTETSSSDGDIPVIGNWESPESMSFSWEKDEEDEKGLIEIELDGKRSLPEQELQRTGEEENMIEIDIFQARLCPPVSPVSLSSNSD